LSLQLHVVNVRSGVANFILLGFMDPAFLLLNRSLHNTTWVKTNSLNISIGSN
jgi:hypothetical protein